MVYGVLHGARATNSILDVVENWIEKLSAEQPIIVTGDLNIETENSRTLRRWRVQGTLVDIHELWAARRGLDPELTTSAKRIDHMWVNQKTCDLTSGFEVVDVFATH